MNFNKKINNINPLRAPWTILKNENNPLSPIR